MSDRIEKLEHLQVLKDKGTLTEEEFQKEKAKILAGEDMPLVVHMGEPPPKPQIMQPTQVTVIQNNNGCLKAFLIIMGILFVLWLIGSLSH